LSKVFSVDTFIFVEEGGEEGENGRFFVINLEKTKHETQNKTVTRQILIKH